MSADSCTAPTVITRDNIHLSKPIPADSVLRAAANNPNSLCTDPKVLEFIAAAKSASTLRAYDSDLAHFVSWGGSIPAQAEQVARYLADHAATLSMATLARRLVGIRSAHVTKGLPDPTHAELVRLTLCGIRRRYGRPQRRVAALSTEELFVIVRTLGTSTKDIRDAALLLIGFAGAFRRSEVSAIDCSNVEIFNTGIRIMLPRSKTDQTGHGRTVFIRRVGGTICPVAALERWLSVARISNGPVFRRIARGGRVLSIRVSSAAVAHLLKARVLAIGRDASQYSGHSLRAGFVTEAARLGVPTWRIRAQTGHLSDSVLQSYIRHSEMSSTELVNDLGSWGRVDTGATFVSAVPVNSGLATLS